MLCQHSGKDGPGQHPGHVCCVLLLQVLQQALLVGRGRGGGGLCLLQVVLRLCSLMLAGRRSCLCLCFLCLQQQRLLGHDGCQLALMLSLLLLQRSPAQVRRTHHVCLMLRAVGWLNQ